MGIGRVPFPDSGHEPSRPDGRKRWLPPLTAARGEGEGCSIMDQLSPPPRTQRLLPGLKRPVPCKLSIFQSPSVVPSYLLWCGACCAVVVRSPIPQAARPGPNVAGPGGGTAMFTLRSPAQRQGVTPPPLREPLAAQISSPPPSFFIIPTLPQAAAGRFDACRRARSCPIATQLRGGESEPR